MGSRTAFAAIVLSCLALPLACGRTELEVPVVVGDSGVPIGEDSGPLPPPPPPIDSGFEDDTGATDTGVITPMDAGVDAPPPPATALRLIAPLSTATVTSTSPELHWALPANLDGALIDLCADRACANLLQTFGAKGTSSQPLSPLATGVYYWRARGTVQGSIATPATPTWEFWVGTSTASIANTSWGTTLDVNGDGFADVAVGASFANADESGAAYVYLGGESDVSTTPSITLPGPGGSGGDFGNVASAGDVNGDGFGDLLVGAFGTADITGSVYVYLGGPGGIATIPATTLSGPDGVNGAFGAAVAGAGDVNGDGFADVVVGAYEAPDAVDTGKVYVYLGSETGLSAVPSFAFSGLDGANARFGAVVASAGDLNGDGFGDIVVGAPLAGSLDSGKAYVYLGSISGLPATPSLAFESPMGSSNFGTAAANAGDVNGDGYADLVIGGYVGSAGAGFQFLGSATGPETAPSTILNQPGVQGVSLLSISLASAGDVNGDGYADVIAGAPFLNSAAGDAFLYLGGPAGLASNALTMVAPPNGGEFGNSVAGAGDVNGDGYADVIVAAPAPGMGDSGYAAFYLGDATGPGAPLIFNDPTATPGGTGFGSWIASLIEAFSPGPV